MRARRHGGTRARRASAAVLLTMVVVLAACGDSGGDSKPAARTPGSDRAQQPTDGERQSVDASRRSVVRTATVRMEVSKPDAAADAARRIAVDAGGYLAGADANGEGGDRTSTVTLRVPEARFDATLGQVARLGEVAERSVRSSDVTDRLVDLQGRLDNAQTSAKRLRELLAQATDIDTIVTLEDRLTERETDIETLSGQLQALDGQATLSSIAVTFVPKHDAKDPGISHDLPGPLRALRAGAVALVNVLQVLLVVVGFALPFLVICGLGLLGFRAWRRRHPRPARPSASGSAVWSSPPPPGSWTPAGAGPPPPPPDPTRGAPSPATDASAPPARGAGAPAPPDPDPPEG